LSWLFIFLYEILLSLLAQVTPTLTDDFDIASLGPQKRFIASWSPSQHNTTQYTSPIIALLPSVDQSDSRS